MSTPFPEAVAAFVAAVDEFHDETNRPSFVPLDGPLPADRSHELSAAVFRTGGALLGSLIESSRIDDATRIQRLLNDLDPEKSWDLLYLREHWEGLKAELQVLALALFARAGSSPPNRPTCDATTTVDPIRQALDEHDREAEALRRWREWDLRVSELTRVAAGAFAALADVPKPRVTADLEQRFRQLGAALSAFDSATRERRPDFDPSRDRVQSDRFRFLADPSHLHIPAAARVFATLVVTAVDEPDQLPVQLARLIGHPLLDDVLGWGLYIGEWQYALQLPTTEPGGWRRLPAPPGSGHDREAVNAGLDCREPERVNRERELFGRVAPVTPPVATVSATSPPPSAQTEGTNAPPVATPHGRKGKRGRKRIDEKLDARLWEAWQTQIYVDYAALAREFQLTQRQVELAIDRVRKRLKKTAG